MRVSLSHARRLASLLKSKEKAERDSEARPLPPEERGRAIGRYNAFCAAVGQGLKDKDFSKIASALNRYRRYVREVESRFLGPKSKYYSSILEELPTLLFKDQVERIIAKLGLDDDNFVLGSFTCRINSIISPDCVPSPEKKAIDFCLAYQVKEDGKWEGSPLPLVGYEVKKYIDKTMFGTVLETWAALRSQRPKTRYGFIVEDDARDDDTIMNSKIYDSEYVLSGQRRSRDVLNDISPDRLEDMYQSILKVLVENLNEFAVARQRRQSRAASLPAADSAFSSRVQGQVSRGFSGTRKHPAG